VQHHTECVLTSCKSRIDDDRIIEIVIGGHKILRITMEWKHKKVDADKGYEPHIIFLLPETTG
jgi:hypothetical protein